MLTGKLNDIMHFYFY